MKRGHRDMVYCLLWYEIPTVLQTRNTMNHFQYYPTLTSFVTSYEQQGGAEGTPRAPTGVGAIGNGDTILALMARETRRLELKLKGKGTRRLGLRCKWELTIVSQHEVIGNGNSQIGAVGNGNSKLEVSEWWFNAVSATEAIFYWGRKLNYWGRKLITSGHWHSEKVTKCKVFCITCNNSLKLAGLFQIPDGGWHSDDNVKNTHFIGE